MVVVFTPFPINRHRPRTKTWDSGRRMRRREETGEKLH